MKFVVERKKLFEAVSLACEAVPAKPVQPVMKNLKLSLPEGGRLLVEATDCEFGVRSGCDVQRTLPADELYEEKIPEALADAMVLYDVLKVSRDSELTLSTEGTRLWVRGEKTDADVPTADPNAYPGWAARPPGGHHALSGQSLARLLDLTSFAAHPAAMKYAINGVLFYLEAAPEDGGEARVTLVGTDCRAMAIASDAARAFGGHHTTRTSAVLPLKSAKLLSGCLSKSKSDAVVEVTFTNNDANFVGDGWCLYSRLLDGAYPNWRGSLAYKLPHACKIEPSEMGACLRQAAIFKEEGKFSRVSLTFGPGDLIMESSTQRGRSKTTMKVESLTGGGKATVTVNADFVKTMLARLPEGDEVELAYGDKVGQPIIFRRPGFVYQVAPLVEKDDDGPATVTPSGASS